MFRVGWIRSRDFPAAYEICAEHTDLQERLGFDDCWLASSISCSIKGAERFSADPGRVYCLYQEEHYRWLVEAEQPQERKRNVRLFGV